MLKVNEEKILFDRKELVEKKEKNLAAIEVDAKAYAVSHGYDEDKTEKFAKFTQELQGDGLSAEESAKLELLSSYIDDVEEGVEGEELKCNIVPTDPNGAIADSTVGAINNI